MKLRRFNYLRPATVQEALDAMANLQPGEYTLIGGGTDALVRMKQRLVSPPVVIGLKSIQGLRGVEPRGDFLTIGAAATIKDVARSAFVRDNMTALATACECMATPQLRNMGTIGGNICLENRCYYYNQFSWAGGFKPCLKRGGRLCHVVKRGTRCYALFCADTPPALIALGAVLIIANKTGVREVPIEQFYRDDGSNPLEIKPCEVLMAIRVPVRAGFRTSYQRHSTRASMDFPEVGVAIGLKQSADGKVEEVRAAATGISSRPVRLEDLENLLKGIDPMQDLSQAVDEGLSKVKVVHPQSVSPMYRKRILKVLARKAIDSCSGKEVEQRD